MPFKESVFIFEYIFSVNEENYFEEQGKVICVETNFETLFSLGVGFLCGWWQTWKKIQPYNQRLCKIVWDIG